jgi:iron complex transport system substrate-binding protein
LNFSIKIIQLSSWQLLKTVTCTLFLVCSCHGKPTHSSENSIIKGAPTVSYAKRFSIDHLKGYSQVSVINPWQGASDIIQKWYLVPRGEQLSFIPDSSAVIQVPIRKIICMSTTHLAMISALDETTSVVGFSGTRFLFGKELKGKVEDGSINEIGYEDNLNKELILKLNPDLIMVYGIGSESAGYIGKLKELGIKVLYNADYLETDPLGKAEWIKLIGALYSKETMADSIFKKLEYEYNLVKVFIKENSVSRPKVLLGLPFKDQWFISPGNSYISRLIIDAGGEYLWQNTVSSVSMPVGLENVYLKALTAEYWLNTGSAVNQSEIISLDPRLSGLPCFKNGNLYNNNKRISSNGGNDYWESGSLNPQIILKDIASILHPDLFPGRELFYYRKLN